MTVQQANEAIWYGKPVLYDGAEYTMIALRKWKNEHEHRFEYSAELQDRVAYSSLVYADLNKVQLKGATDIEKG